MYKFRSYNKDVGKFIYFVNGEYFYGESSQRVSLMFFDWDNAEMFSGLNDKNGKEVYQGDICRFNWNPFFNEPSDIFEFELPVMYYDGWGCWCFHLQTKKMNEKQRDLFIDYDTQELYVAIGSPIMYGEGIEVIGNIHDQP